MEPFRSSIQSCLSGHSDAIDKLRKEILWQEWTLDQSNNPNPDQIVTLTWAQWERLFAIAQDILATLDYAERRRVQKLEEAMRQEIG